MDKNFLPIVDRKVQFDEKSRLYRAVEGIEKKPLRSRAWLCDLNLDQGREGACVGFAWTHELASKPRPVIRDTQFALDIYNRARQIDPWPGEDYSGTSVLAGIKAVMEIENSRGNPLIKEYRWAFGTEEVLRVIGYRGPVVLGIEWQSSFYYPHDNGFIYLSDDPVGGHAILAKGVNIVLKDAEAPNTYDNVDVHQSFVTLHNSWGEDWGIGGDCFMSVYDLNHLLMDRDGEACIPMRRSKDV